MEAARVLVVDDEPSILMLLNDALTQWGYQVICAGTGSEALTALKTQVFDAALTDVRMPDMSGLDLLREIKKRDESIEVVIMTGYPTISSAAEALKEGAYDYLSKPLILDELHHLMQRLMERRFLRGEVHSLRVRLGEELTVNELIGSSPGMQRMKDVIGKVAVTNSPVLIEGESGTGKELVAAAIHRLSARAKGPFIPVNCSAIPRDLLESEFFGHVRGAFSGAVADARAAGGHPRAGEPLPPPLQQALPAGGARDHARRPGRAGRLRFPGQRARAGESHRARLRHGRPRADRPRRPAEPGRPTRGGAVRREQGHPDAGRGGEGADPACARPAQQRQRRGRPCSRHLPPDDLSPPEGVRQALTRPSRARPRPLPHLHVRSLHVGPRAPVLLGAAIALPGDRVARGTTGPA